MYCQFLMSILKCQAGNVWIEYTISLFHIWFYAAVFYGVLRIIFPQPFSNWKFNWRRWDLNPVPSEYQSNMLPTELSWLDAYLEKGITCFVLFWLTLLLVFYLGQNLVDKANESFGSRLIIQFARQKHLTKNRRKMKKKEI